MHITWFLSFIFCSLSLSAQWAPEGATWYYTQKYFHLGHTGFNTLTVKGDTLIQGKTCRKLQYRTANCNHRPREEYMYEEDQRIHYYEASLDSFLLLYDFSLGTGDSYQTWAIVDFFSSRDTLNVHIDATYTTLINGQARMVQEVSITQVGLNTTGQATFIEGIGNMGLLHPWNYLTCDGTYDTALRCYEDPQLGRYSTGASQYCNEILLGPLWPETLEDWTLSLYPNPAQEQIQWNTPPGEFDITITDSQGKIVRQARVNQNEISLEGLGYGVYHLQLQTQFGQTVRGKFVRLGGQ